jgi:carboxypeptidase C (cathepsin A)
MFIRLHTMYFFSCALQIACTFHSHAMTSTSSRSPVMLVLLVLLASLAFASADSGPTPVKMLPGLAQLVDTMSTGYIATGDAYNSQIFYWFSEARNPKANASETPIVLWLQGGQSAEQNQTRHCETGGLACGDVRANSMLTSPGCVFVHLGPGCSGGLGWFYENGPYNLQIDQTLSVNNYSWSETAHLLYVDQPIGTGFSTLDPSKGTSATYVTTIQEQTAQLYTVLKSFFSTHFPQYAANPFTITGESYAGKYIPNLATAILDGQKEFPLNLVSIAIGDGWASPLIQTSVYGDQAYNLGLIDQNEVNYVNAQFANCTALTNAKSWQNAQIVCDGLLNWIVTTAGNINVDDVREWNDDEHDPRLEIYLSNPQVQTALSLINPPSAYQSCNGPAGQALSPDEMQPSAHLIPRLVDSLSMVYLYEGSFDMNCGVVGVEKYLYDLYPAGMAAAEKYIWYGADSSVSGYYRQVFPTLYFIVLQDAGHMVPKTQPASSADMLNHLLTLTPFTSNPGKAKLHDAASVEAPKPSQATRGRVPHLHHKGRVPTSVRLPKKSSSSSSSSPSKPRRSVDISPILQKSPDSMNITFNIPAAGSIYQPLSLLATSWTGGIPVNTLQVDIYDAESLEFLATVGEDVPNSNAYGQQWAFGLPGSLPCGRDLVMRITDTVSSTPFDSAAWSISCPTLTILEPSIPGTVFPQGGSVLVGWMGGSPDADLQIFLFNQGSGAKQLLESSWANSKQYYLATLPEPLDCTDSFYIVVSDPAVPSTASGQPFQVVCPFGESATQQPQPEIALA